MSDFQYTVSSHIKSLVLITGISGGGRSSAAQILSDQGYYVAENLPTQLLNSFLDISNDSLPKYHFIALTLDVDSEDKVDFLLQAVKKFKTEGTNVTLLYLDAQTPVLLQRYSETRRPHPGFDPKIDKGLADTIERERQLLSPLKNAASYILDTTSLNVHELKRDIKELILKLSSAPLNPVFVKFESFGFKHGFPRQCDLLIDVRFLKNPYFEPSLREHTGLNEKVKEYVFSDPRAKELLAKYSDLLNFLLPEYAKEGKSYLSVAIGCTGGKHRSVALAEALAQTISIEGFNIHATHRDIPTEK